MSDIEQRLRGENPEHCVVTDRLRANIGMPDTFQFDRDDAVELDELVLEAADEIARLEADNASLRSKLEEAEGAQPKNIEKTADQLAASLGVLLRDWLTGPKPLEGDGLEHVIKLRIHRLLTEAALASLREADHA